MSPRTAENSNRILGMENHREIPEPSGAGGLFGRSLRQRTARLFGGAYRAVSPGCWSCSSLAIYAIGILGPVGPDYSRWNTNPKRKRGREHAFPRWRFGLV